MKNRILTLTAIVTAIAATSSFADNYKIIIDAGSSGSRVHLFQYDETQSLPAIKDIFSESTKPGLSSYENNPTAAGQSLKKLLDDVSTQLQNKHIATHDVELNVLATAGMRLLSNEKQAAIYADVKKFITDNHYDFKMGRVETIPGKMEAIYGWLDLNYLANKFQNDTATLGSIDMGGASTQIAYTTNDMQKPADIVAVNVNGKHYTVFAKSFLGLGEDQARDAMSHENDADYCFPTDYQVNANNIGEFNLAGCATAFEKIIRQHNVTNEILPISEQQEFDAFSGAYYTYNFLAADKTPDAAIFENDIQTVCAQPWTQLQHNYPQIDAKYLSTYCANAVYMDDLFYHAYQLHNKQLAVVSQVNGHDLDWTLGAMLFSLLK